MLRRCFVILALLCLPSLATAADVPYTGNLFESGTPVNGNRYIQFDIYDFPFGGPSLSTQAESLAVVNGVFHTVLSVPDVVWFNGPNWIGASINGGPELSPRVKYYAPPRLSPLLFEGTPGFKNVTANTWTKVDSVTVVASGPGYANVSHSGTAMWTGSVTVPVIEFAISSTTPTAAATGVQPAHTGSMAPLNFSVVVPVNAGTTKIYFWAKIITTGQSYSIQTGRFQALYLPN